MPINFAFSKALIECRIGGKKIRRAGWAEGEWVEYQSPDPDLLFHQVGGDLATWDITVPDVLANDWSTVA